MKLFGIAGLSGMGKTTLLERLVPELTRRGLVVSLIKHSHKAIEIDRPGKDSYRLREAGCTEVLLVGQERWALMHELRGADEPPLEYLIGRLQGCDLVLIEGFKQGRYPKLEVWRAALGRPPLGAEWPGIVAAASDEPDRLPGGLPAFDLADVAAIADFVLARAIPATAAAMAPPPAAAAATTDDAAALHVLILCTHNSARSVLAEGMLNHWARRLGRNVVAHSAGSAPRGRLNPYALEVLAAAGIDTAGLRSKSWDEFGAAGAPPLAAVITVCDSAAAEVCPVFHGRTGEAPVKVHWGYPDPSDAEGGDEGKRRAFELTRQALGYRMLQLLARPLESMDRPALQAALADIVRT